MRRNLSRSGGGKAAICGLFAGLIDIVVKAGQVSLAIMLFSKLSSH